MIFILTVVVIALAHIGGTWAIVLLIVAAILEIGEIIFLRRWAGRLRQRYRPQSPEEQLVGLIAEVVTSCRPTGQVRVRGEIWEARCEAGAPEGASVRVDRVESLTLFVSPT
ncbi:MAG TPA: NfeD family protein [Gaiellaceae bacterium]|nr:NfeD family protein [Gaiellaceae bacterium]